MSKKCKVWEINFKLFPNDSGDFVMRQLKQQTKVPYKKIIVFKIDHELKDIFVQVVQKVTKVVDQDVMASIFTDEVTFLDFRKEHAIKAIGEVVIDFKRKHEDQQKRSEAIVFFVKEVFYGVFEVDLLVLLDVSQEDMY